MDGLDRGTIEVDRGSDWLFVGLSGVSTMEEKMGILRSAFGPSKDEIWTQIATDIGGEFIEGG